MRRSWWALFVAGWVAGCQQARSETAERSSAIIGGDPADIEMDATVLLLNVDGGFSACSGSVVAPRVVVTAKHCLGPDPTDPAAPLGIRVLTRASLNRDDQYDVIEGRTTEGADIDGLDFAVLIVDRDIDLGESPYYEVSRDQSTLNDGDLVKLAGYGQSDAEGQGRGFRKLQTVDEIQDVAPDIIYSLGRGACSGDSGGTLLDPQGRLAGVMVRADCAGWTLSERVDNFLDILDWGLEETGICVPDPEVCNGIDDDCDGFVDPGCAVEDDPCLEDRSCAEGLSCLEESGQSSCAVACTPAGSASCGPGSYCDALGPELGRCRPGVVGPLGAGAACEVDANCASLACVAGTCRIECSPNVVPCPFGLVCVADVTSPGICESPAEAPDAPLVLGDPCGRGGVCATDLACVGAGPDRYCAPGCAAGCPAGFHCRGDACARGELGEAGSSCVDDLDCADGTDCVVGDGVPQLAGARVCAPPCEAGCGAGLSCVGDRCLPERGVVGSSCGANEDCGTLLCGHFGDGERCTERCGGVDACPTGTVCVLQDDGVNLLCRTPPAGRLGGGGCSAAGPAEAPSLLGAATLLLGLCGLLRRRRHP